MSFAVSSYAMSVASMLWHRSQALYVTGQLALQSPTLNCANDSHHVLWFDGRFVMVVYVFRTNGRNSYKYYYPSGQSASHAYCTVSLIFVSMSSSQTAEIVAELASLYVLPSQAHAHSGNASADDWSLPEAFQTITARAQRQVRCPNIRSP